MSKTTIKDKYDKRKLHKKAWKVWSIYRRKSAANFQGYLECFTCLKKIPWKEAHLGHFKHGKLDFDPVNTNPQCAGCNTYGHGKLDRYGIRLVELYGLSAIKNLELRANQKGNDYSTDELKQILNEYQYKVSQIR